MTDADTSTTTTPQFTITRTIDASRERIFTAWTDPDEATQWWGPRGVRTPRETMTLEPWVGGAWCWTMISDSDGTEYPCIGVVLEIEPPERLSFTWGNPGEESPPVVTLTLRDLGGSTELTLHVAGLAGEPGDDNVYDGWSEDVDMLVEHLA